MCSHTESWRTGTLLSRTEKQGVCLFIACVLLVGTAGCSYFKGPRPTSLGEGSSGYTYIPIDPNKVQIEIAKCEIGYSNIGEPTNGVTKGGTERIPLLKLLPDNAVRMSTELTDSAGTVTYGPAKAGASGSSYKLTADYVNSDTVNKNVWIRRTILVSKRSFISKTYSVTSERMHVPISEGTFNRSITIKKDGVEDSYTIPGTDAYEVKTPDELKKAVEEKKAEKHEYEEFNVPIYVGIGLRIVAEGRSLSGDISISGLGVVGAEAEAKRLTGSMTVQTLGVNSQQVASALPVQSELSRTTAENAFVAIGSIKAMLHQPETIKYPRVVGFYLPFPGGRPLVNALISELSRNPVTWCPCGHEKAEQEKQGQQRK